MENRLVERTVAIPRVKFNDLLMNLTYYRDSITVHTKRLCSGAAREASWWMWHLRWRGVEVGDRQWKKAQVVQIPYGSWRL